MQDADLIARALSGDEDSFAVIVDRYLSAVYTFAYRYVQNADDADDVAQEAFLRAWKHLRTFDVEKNFKTWILTIAKNAALDHIKKKKPVLFSQIEQGERDIDAVLAPYVEDPDLPEDLFEAKEKKAELEAALSLLPPPYRVVLIMRYDDGLKFREIAEILGEPVDTVKSKHRRALLRLRELGRPRT